MIDYTISIQDCYFKVLDVTNNKFQDLKLSNIRMEFNSNTFLAYDNDKQFKIAAANLSRVNSGAFATFTDLWSYINTGRSACLESNNNLNGDVTGTFANNHVSSLQGKPMPDGLPTDKNILMYDSASGSYKFKNIYTDFPNIVYSSVVDGTTITGVTTEQISSTNKIKGGTIKTTDILRMYSFSKYGGNSGTKTKRIWINTTPVLSGAMQIALSTVGNTVKRSDGCDRILAVKSASVTEVMAVNTASSSSSANSAGTLAALPIDWTLDQYIIETEQLGVNTDTATCSHRFLEKIPTIINL